MSVLVLHAALALVLAGVPQPDEVREELSRLASPHASEREAAQRWLTARLRTEDYGELADAALAGDAEVRERLVRVLSGDPRHLFLALLLCEEKEPSLAGLGSEALRAGVARFDPHLGEPALQGEAARQRLHRLASLSPPRLLRLDASLSLERLVEQLELAGELPLGLALDGKLATRTIRRPEEPLVGPWDELLPRLASAIGFTIECHGLGPVGADEDGHGGFVYLSDSGPGRTGVEVLSGWMRTLLGTGEAAARERAARNLGASGFSPALGWMEHLVRTRDDRAAREGLLCAAARGRVTQALLEPATFDALLADLAGPADAHTRLLACALARSGCLAADGSALAARVLATWDQSSPRARWVRLSWFERNACSSPEATRAARAVLADGAAPGALRLQALHALVALAAGAPIEAPVVAGLPDLARAVLGEVELERLGRALRVCGLEPPGKDPQQLSGTWTPRERRNVLELWLWNGAVDPAAAHLLEFLAGPPGELAARADTLAEALGPWLLRGQGEQVGAVLARARALAGRPNAGLERVALALGLVPARDVPAALASAGWTQAAPLDLALAASLAGYPQPLPLERQAEDALLAAVTRRLEEPRDAKVPPEIDPELLGALERALRGMYAAGRDQAGDQFLHRLGQALGRAPRGSLARRIEQKSWPRPPWVEVRDLERELGRFEPPAGL